MKFRDHAFATDHGQGNQHADGLGQGGAKCCACGTKLQHADEQIIQGNIKSTGNRNEKHRTLRVSYAAENGADDVDKISGLMKDLDIVGNNSLFQYFYIL